MDLDIGAGTDRDALYMAEQGLDVIAVEPIEELLAIAKTATVQWISDELPDLYCVEKLQIQFDLILLSAVWMHIPPAHRQRSLRKLTNLIRVLASEKHGEK